MLDQDQDIDSESATAEDWTPLKGFARALLWGSLTALLFGLFSGVVAYYFPNITLQFLLRAILAFVMAWVLFAVVQWAAGMVGWPCSVLAIALTVLVLLSHHVIWAIYGVVGREGLVIGPAWLHPMVLLVVTVLPSLIGGGGAYYLCGKMGAEFSDVVNLLTGGSSWRDDPP